MKKLLYHWLEMGDGDNKMLGSMEDYVENK
jgi:hypothetical protein